MPSIFPDTVTGGVVYRDGDGVCLSPPDVVNAYCPDPAFTTTCQITALPSNCNARLQPAQINAIVSELLCLAETWAPEGSWDCSAFCNLSAAFGAWATTFAPNPVATVEAICDSGAASASLAACLIPVICATVDVRTDLAECLVSEDVGNQIQVVDGRLFVSPGGAVGNVAGYLFKSETEQHAGDLDHDITFFAGITASDDAVPVLMYAAAPMTKRADAVFAEGDNQGGMVTGEALPVNGTIHLWRIMKADGTIDYCFNNHTASGYAPTLPTDFIYKRRLASLTTDASANIHPYIQTFDEFQLKAPRQISFTTGLGTTASLFGSGCPTGAKMEVLYGGFTSNAAANSSIRISDPDTPDASVTSANLTHNSPVASVPATFGKARVRTNAATQVRARAAVANTTFAFNIEGWIDTRGRLG